MLDVRGRFEEAVQTHGVRGLASRIGVTPAYVSMIVNGKRALTPQVLTRLEEGVNKPMASLARLERATHCLEGSCSIQLSYRDTLCARLA